MKVQYLGDVNDYRKYALLRLLAGAGFKIGVNWLLTPDDGRNDGGKRGYLQQPESWRSYDPELFDLLSIVPPTPSIGDFRQIEGKGIIPGAVYWDDIVPVGTGARQAFQAQSVDRLQSCDLIFFDPDNGLATASISKGRRAGVKFVFDDELADHYRVGRSLLIYQHFPRVERSGFIGELDRRLRLFGPDAEMWACTTSHVVFMLVGNPAAPSDHIGRISAAVETGRRRWPETFIHFRSCDGS